MIVSNNNLSRAIIKLVVVSVVLAGIIFAVVYLSINYNYHYSAPLIEGVVALFPLSTLEIIFILETIREAKYAKHGRPLIEKVPITAPLVNGINFGLLMLFGMGLMVYGFIKLGSTDALWIPVGFVVAGGAIVGFVISLVRLIRIVRQNNSLTEEKTHYIEPKQPRSLKDYLVLIIVVSVISGIALLSFIVTFL